jgi:Uma2 family endonuclease
MSTTVRMTADELAQLPDDGTRKELVDGELVTMSPSGRGHGVVTGRLYAALYAHIQQGRLGEVYTESTGVLLRHDPDLVRCPDISFVRRARLSAAIDYKYVGLIPDLVVEVISPSDRVYDVERKLQEYQAADVAWMWVVSPIARTVTVYERGRPAQVLGERETLTGGSVVPGFQLALTELFAELQRDERA